MEAGLQLPALIPFAVKNRAAVPAGAKPFAPAAVAGGLHMMPGFQSPPATRYLLFRIFTESR